MDTSLSHSNNSEYVQSYSNVDDFNSRSGDGDVQLLRQKYKQTNNRVYHDFYKTKVCSLYNLNICKKGKSCPFAHTNDELRDKPNLFKTKLCDAFLQGTCNKGEQCTFAHGEDELRSTPDLFKTAICHLWSQGRCSAGDQCRFAHGDEDLRPAPSHQKFKRKTFNNFNNKKPHQPMHHAQNNEFMQGQGGYNQYSYPQNFYGYPMYPMPMMPTDMQSPYMMGGQPYVFNNYGGEGQLQK